MPSNNADIAVYKHILISNIEMELYIYNNPFIIYNSILSYFPLCSIYNHPHFPLHPFLKSHFKFCIYIRTNLGRTMPMPGCPLQHVNMGRLMQYYSLSDDSAVQ